MENWKIYYIKYRYIAWPIISGLASVIILVLLIIPQMLAYFNTNTQIAGLNSQASSLEAKAQALEQVSDAQTQSDLKIALKMLPTDRDVPQAMAILQNYVLASGLNLVGSNYVSSNKNQGSFQFSVTVRGPLPIIKNFINGLQKMPGVFQIEALTIQFQPGGQVEAGLPITVFYDSASTAKIKSVSDINLNEKEQGTLAQISQYVSSGLSQLESSSSANIDSVPLGKFDPFQ